MKELSREGKLNTEAINEIMSEDKPNQRPRIQISLVRIEKYFPEGTSEKQIENTIIKALEYYRQRQKRKQR